MGENVGKLKELISQITPEQLAVLKARNEEIIFKANELIEECKEVLNS